MKFKKFLLTFLVLAVSLSLNAKPVAKLYSDATKYTQTETGYIIHFDLQATLAEFTEVGNLAAELSDRLVFIGQENGVNNFECTLTIDHQNQPEYVHKMMLALGITTLIYNDTTFPISKITEILYSFQ